MTESIQEKFAPKSICFGCGPANEKGLHIRSFVDGNGLIAQWQPKPEHQAFPGMLNGGIIGALLDCHCNWTAAWHLMQTQHLNEPPCTVTANYQIKLLRPTPVDVNLQLKSFIRDATHDRVNVAGELYANEKLCATCEGLFVAVKQGHPAYHRW